MVELFKILIYSVAIGFIAGLITVVIKNITATIPKNQEKIIELLEEILKELKK